MAEPYLAEIRVFSFNFAPKGWAACNGQLLPINQNQALFSILGTTYGGDGRVNFALPNLRGRVPLYAGQGIALGQSAGSDAVTLTINQLPNHFHTLTAVAPNDSTPNTNLAGDNFFSNSAPNEIYNSGSGGPNVLLPVTQTISLEGGSQPHENRQPFLVLNFCIALQGIFPSRN